MSNKENEIYKEAMFETLETMFRTIKDNEMPITIKDLAQILKEVFSVVELRMLIKALK
jgi:hypothetical protein